MVSTKIKNDGSAEKESYPVLKKTEAQVVLFNAPRRGMVVHNYENRQGRCPIGDFSESWVEDQFMKLSDNAVINLSNGELK